MNSWVLVPLFLCLLTAVLTLFPYPYKGARQSIHYLGALLYLGSVLNVAWWVWGHGVLRFDFGGYPAGIAISFVVDDFSGLLLVVTGIIQLAVALYAPWDHTLAWNRSFYPAFWFMTAGITGVLCAGDLFNMYVWFELMIVSSFVLLVHARSQELIHSTLYYVGLNTLATLILLLAIGYLYGVTGTLDLRELAHFHESDLLLRCMIILMVAFAIKAGLFPFYFWLPESYHLTSVSAGAIFAGLLTKVGLYALIRMGTLFFKPDSLFMQGLVLIACLTMLSGVFGAMGGYHVRRILSFHIVSQVGYMALGLAMGTSLALAAAIFYMIHHILVKTNLFLISGVMTRTSNKVDLREMGGFFKKTPLLMLVFLIAALSLAGLPPLSGFWAKFLLLKAALDSGFWWSSLIIVLVGFFTLFSMTKMWRFAFLNNETTPISNLTRVQQAGLMSPIILLAVLTCLIGIYPEPLFKISEQAAKSLIDKEGVHVAFR